MKKITDKNLRRRVNVSLSLETYEKLQGIRKKYGFKDLCKLMTTLVQRLLDAEEVACKKRHSLPEDDKRYIDAMFDDFAHAERMPDGAAPLRHKNRRLQ